MKISRETLQTIVNYSNVSSKDETRPWLNTVFIAVLDDKMLLKATDGYCFIESTHNIVDASTIEQALLHTDDIKLLGQILKNKGYKTFTTFELSLEDNIFKLSTSKNGVHLMMANLSNREYPNTETIKPSTFREIETIGYNPFIIEQLKKAVFGSRKPKYATPPFIFKFGGQKLGPTEVTCKYEGINHYMMIMPMKIEGGL